MRWWKRGDADGGAGVHHASRARSETTGMGALGRIAGTTGNSIAKRLGDSGPETSETEPSVTSTQGQSPVARDRCDAASDSAPSPSGHPTHATAASLTSSAKWLSGPTQRTSPAPGEPEAKTALSESQRTKPRSRIEGEVYTPKSSECNRWSPTCPSASTTGSALLEPEEVVSTSQELHNDRPTMAHGFPHSSSPSRTRHQARERRAECATPLHKGRASSDMGPA